jgi:hypothetical protein
MATRRGSSIVSVLVLFICGALLVQLLSSCGKSTISTAGLNVQYEIFNLSPDLFPVNLYVDNNVVNRTPFVFQVPHGYFYLPSIDTPFQIRTTLVSGATLFSRSDLLKTGLKYSLFITGAQSDNSIIQIFTVDTASLPAIGRGKIRFLNASPTGTAGLDVYANGTQAFSKITYTNYSKYIELPVGNYDIQITATGATSVLKEITPVTVQDGRLYTIYAYGYTSRIDTAAFNAAVITNK